MGFEFFDICYIIIHSKFPYGRFRIIIISMETETKEINNVFFKDIHLVVHSFLSVRNVTSGRLAPSRLPFRVPVNSIAASVRSCAGEFLPP